MNQKTANNVEDLSFEQALEKLNSLVKDFQTGDLKLKDAVEKYELCKNLIKHCNQKLDAPEPKASAIKDAVNVDFEANINKLEAMRAVLLKDTASLEEIQQIQRESAVLLKECEAVLGDFKCEVEYKE